jgi:hypothetical protein
MIKNFNINKTIYMKKLLILVGIIWSGTTFGQLVGTPDTLVKLGGRKIPAYIKNVGATMVYYSTPEKPKENFKIDRKDLEKAIFRSGRVEIFNKPAFQLIAEGQWEAVLITEDIKETDGLYKRKEISAKSSPSDSKKKARQNAITKLQKQAANAGGCIVYVTKTEYYGGYGDPAGCIMEGIAYGVEPVEEGTDVINKKDENKNTPKPESKSNDTKSSTSPTTTNTQKTTSSASSTSTGTTKPSSTTSTNKPTTSSSSTTKPTTTTTNPANKSTNTKTTTPAKPK